MQIDQKLSERTIKNFARRVMRRAKAAKLREILLEDIEQECWIAWCKARSSYNPTMSTAFSTYLYRGLQLHINRWMEGFERQSALAYHSINDQVSEDGDELGDILEAAINDETSDFLQVDLVLRRLSDRARLFVKLLANPTRDLFDQVERVSQRADFARRRGMVSVAPRHITGRLVFDLMGCTPAERMAIIRELKGFSSEFSQ
jgi:DNA-directed RNA polymerase specialized sigma24 family protein